MLSKGSNSLRTALLILTVLLITSLVAAEYAQLPYRQTSKQRSHYRETASGRYNDRLDARSKTATTAALPPITTQRPSFVENYSKQREYQFNNEYSANKVDTTTKFTPREQYLKEWSKLTPAVQSQLTTKRQRLQDAYTSSSQPWISFNTQDFIDYALKGPRPYWLWLTLTILDQSAHCPTCVTYHNYWQQVTPGFQNASINDPDDPTPMVMVVVEPSQAKEIWRALNLNRAPVSVLLPPDFDLSSRIEIQNVMSSGVLRQTMMMNPSMEDLVNPLTANGFTVNLPPPPQPGIFLLTFAFTLIAGVMYAGYLCFPWLLKLQQHRALFLVPALVFYLYAAAGGGFIKTNKPAGTGFVQGLEMWIHREYTQMYGIELYIIMAAHAMTALGLWCGVTALMPLGLKQKILNITTPVSFDHDQIELNEVKKSTDSEESASTTATPTGPIITTLDQSLRLERRLGYYIFSVLNPDFLFAIGFGIFFIGYYALIQLYKVKMPSYPIGF